MIFPKRNPRVKLIRIIRKEGLHRMRIVAGVSGKMPPSIVVRDLMRDLNESDSLMKLSKRKKKRKGRG
jgi:hypothetical protein